MDLGSTSHEDPKIKRKCAVAGWSYLSGTFLSFRLFGLTVGRCIVGLRSLLWPGSVALLLFLLVIVENSERFVDLLT